MPSTTENTLAPYTRLSPSIYLLPPRTPINTTTPESKPKPPSTIILSFWYAAPARALAKYVAQYAQLAPSSRIIFILSGPRDFYFYPTQASHRRRLKPAIDLLQTPTDAENDDCYIHLFSNGGMFTTAHLLLAYKHATGKPLRISAMVLDSSPGVAVPSKSLQALAYGVPQTLILRQIVYGLLAMLVWGSWLVKRLLLRMEDPFAFARRATLDKDLVTTAARSSGKEEADNNAVIKYCYIYSESDDLVPSKDVEEHAAHAVAKGREVELEKFDGSPHVGHMRQDPERYWAIVERFLFR
ncbi:hypothetical protein PISL3812_03749 [Talaromyces islandicus]|uniref:Indole-diterpene biosynthesis protein PaxU n=1 Tax=Talaromyces islandicus TaxID=28573 RepID=A0A0U1LTM0_TALIS|nr:hypothetical protein PISL3812_03749 [Talaromyces islandicus]